MIGQCGGRDELTGDLQTRTQPPHVICQAGEHDGGHSQDDGHRHRCVGGGQAVHVHIAHGHRDQKAEEHRDAAEIGHRVAVSLTGAVRLVGHIPGQRQPTDKRRAQQRDEESGDEDGGIAVEQAHRGNDDRLKLVGQRLDRLGHERVRARLDRQQRHQTVDSRDDDDL